MTPRPSAALVCAGLACVLAATGCSAAGASHASVPPARTGAGLRLVDLSLVSGGDEHDEIGASDNGRWWVIARYPSNRVVRVNILDGAVDELPGLRRRTGAAYTITGSGRVGPPAAPPPHTDLLLDRTERGHQLSVEGHTVYLSRQSGNRGRAVAQGYPRLEIEQEPSFSNGGLTENGRTITVPTTRGYDPDDRNRRVDVYQFDLRTGGITWVSRRSVFAGHGVAVSPNGRYVVFDGAPAAAARSLRDAPLRWDRRSRRTTLVSPARTTSPGHGVTGQFSVTDHGRVAFVANDCDLTVRHAPRGAQACLYVSPPAPGRR